MSLSRPRILELRDDSSVFLDLDFFVGDRHINSRSNDVTLLRSWSISNSSSSTFSSLEGSGSVWTRCIC